MPVCLARAVSIYDRIVACMGGAAWSPACQAHHQQSHPRQPGAERKYEGQGQSFSHLVSYAYFCITSVFSE